VRLSLSERTFLALCILAGNAVGAIIALALR
jgi:hypothetical protein